MRWSKAFVAVSSCAIVGMLSVSCTPAATPAATQKSAPATPTKTTAVTASPTAVTGALTPTPKAAPGEPRYGGILTRAHRYDIPHLDMHQETTASIQFAISPCYSLLVQYDPFNEERIIGDLAKGWDISPDGLTYTFRLNEGVKFHDGKQLTSEDVKFNLDRIVFPPKGMLSPRKPLYQGVDKIEASDPTTVRIILKRPQASFLQLLALAKNFIFAPQVVKDKGDMKNDIVGTGPFRLLSYVRDVSLKVQRNPDYFVKGRPYLDGMTTYVIKDEMARLSALRTRQILMVPLAAGPSGNQARELLKWNAALVAQSRVTPNITWLIPNVKVEPWSDVRVRQAVNLLIDREAAAKVVRAGDYYPAYGYLMPGSPWALSEDETMALPGFRKPKNRDIAEAKKLLDEAGYPHGLKIPLITSSAPQAKDAAEFSRNELARIGIAADIQILELATAKDRLFKGAFEITCYADGSSLDDPDLLLNEYYLTGSPKNYGGWSNPKFDELYTAQSETLDTAKRLEMLREMQRIIHREAPKTIITWGGFWAVWWDEMKNWTPHRSLKRNHKFQDVWLASR